MERQLQNNKIEQFKHDITIKRNWLPGIKIYVVYKDDVTLWLYV